MQQVTASPTTSGKGDDVPAKLGHDRENAHTIASLRKLRPWCKVVQSLPPHPDPRDVRTAIQWRNALKPESKGRILLSSLLRNFDCIVPIYHSNDADGDMYALISVTETCREEHPIELLLADGYKSGLQISLGEDPVCVTQTVRKVAVVRTGTGNVLATLRLRPSEAFLLRRPAWQGVLEACLLTSDGELPSSIRALQKDFLPHTIPAILLEKVLRATGQYISLDDNGTGSIHLPQPTASILVAG